MKAKHFLMIAILLLTSAAGAQQVDRSGLYRVQSSEQAAMTYLTYVVDPQYPADIKISGKVVLRIVIDKEGHVSETSLVSGDPLLAGATVDAVKQWKFHPYIVDKAPVEVETTATVEFNADPRHVITPKPPPEPRLRISMGVADGLVLRRVEPAYPEEAKNNGVQGDVILAVTVDKQGNVINSKVVSGHPLLAEAALNAVKQWKYKPYLLNDEPVEFQSTVRIQFRF